ncbi:Acetylcholine receptor subunit beta-like 1 [Bulinus truncatus]|nr:Acetylcholine receptor subunit beta-like 1 [Bulinus truncatus]
MFWVQLEIVFICLCLYHAHGHKKRSGMSYEETLVNKVIESYKQRTTLSRPVLNFNDTLQVRFAVQLTQIMSLNEQDQVLTLNIWDQLSWSDVQLQWNDSDYGGVTDVRIPCEHIWTPDIKLHNYADLRLKAHRDALCIISKDGSIYHVPQVVYRSSCPIDVYVFPFDIQNCTLKFGSWTYNGLKLDLQFYEEKHWIDLTEYVESSSWAILDVPAYRHIKNLSCCPDEFWVELQYHLVFQRRSALYNYILILPAFSHDYHTQFYFIPPSLQLR